MARTHALVYDGLADIFWTACDRAVEEVQPFCESPIEAMLGAGFLVASRARGIGDLVRVCPEPKMPAKIEWPMMLLVPQYHWQEWRIDWALRGHDCILFIECDGHDFHERTPEQAARDRSKDRAIQGAGIKVLRFTGTEIHRELSKCVLEIVDTYIGITDLKAPKNQQHQPGALQ